MYYSYALSLVYARKIHARRCSDARDIDTLIADYRDWECDISSGYIFVDPRERDRHILYMANVMLKLGRQFKNIYATIEAANFFMIVTLNAPTDSTPSLTRAARWGLTSCKAVMCGITGNYFVVADCIASIDEEMGLLSWQSSPVTRLKYLIMRIRVLMAVRTRAVPVPALGNRDPR